MLSWQRSPHGAIHHTFLITTADRSYALRAYRYTADDRWRIEREHALIAYIRSQGLPAVAPIPLPTDETILEQDGYFYALFPFAPGYQVEKNALTEGQIAAMGSLLGKLHKVLRHYPRERVPDRSFTHNLTTTLGRIDKLEAVIQSLLVLEDEDIQSVEQLEQRRDWLTSLSSTDGIDFALLDFQVIHGDYQETNLFFEADDVSAIIDWDQAYSAPRAWEVVRTLHYALRLDARTCGIFLDAYRCVLPLTLEELDVAAAAYGKMRDHDVWQYEELYIRGNQRIRAFIQAGRFVPFGEQWSQLRNVLHS